MPSDVTREEDPYAHEGIDGWHHHHGPFGAVTFMQQGSKAFERSDPDDPTREYSMHYATHDEYQGNDEPCRDAKCIWSRI